MKALRLFSMAALALVMAACAKEVNAPTKPEQQSGMLFHATLSAPNSGADTKTVYTQDGTTIHVAWKAGDQIALIHNGVKDVATVTALDGSGNATIEGTITGSPSDGDDVVLFYPADAVTASGSGTDYDPNPSCWDKVNAQAGTLDYIQDNLDFRLGNGKLAVGGDPVTASLKANVGLTSMISIWKLSLEDGSGNEVEATALKVRVGGTTVAAANSSAKSDYYIGLLPAHMGTGHLTIDATVSSKAFFFTKATGVNLTAGKYYQSTVPMLDLLQTPLTLEATTDGTIVVNHAPSGMQYSKNGGAKTPVSGEITVAVGDKVAFYGNGTSIKSYHNTYDGTFVGTAQVTVYGNIMSLVNEYDFAGDTTVPADQAFHALFYQHTNLIDASSLLLPATNLSNYCYEYMFSHCTGLTAAPELPATMLSQGSYYNMFWECTSLKDAPELPATGLAEECYYYMFSECTSLKDAPELPSTEMARQCYYYMFSECTNLKEAPELPATTLSNGCYGSMFSGCTSLSVPPVLPATTLAENCYAYMFYDCIGLTAAPTLPATTLAASCYYGMFQGCINLTTAPALPTTTLTNHCYGYMFKDCTKLTAAPELPATTLTQSCYIGMFSGCENLSSVTCLATDISANGCTENWLSGVAATGTFTKASTMSSWTTGASGIPSGWTVNP